MQTSINNDSLYLQLSGTKENSIFVPENFVRDL